MAVGGSFAVLVAEQLAASGCELLVSVTSAGQITPLGVTPCFVLIDRALSDEGTSAHYVPPARRSRVDDGLAKGKDGAFDHLPEPVLTGSSWTTDAPYRETASAIAAAEHEGIACVEKEAASLYAYAYATATGARVVCLAHITNTMATAGDDFEKGLDNGVHERSPSRVPWRPPCAERHVLVIASPVSRCPAHEGRPGPGCATCRP